MRRRNACASPHCRRTSFDFSTSDVQESVALAGQPRRCRNMPRGARITFQARFLREASSAESVIACTGRCRIGFREKGGLREICWRFRSAKTQGRRPGRSRHLASRKSRIQSVQLIRAEGREREMAATTCVTGRTFSILATAFRIDVNYWISAVSTMATRRYPPV